MTQTNAALYPLLHDQIIFLNYKKCNYLLGISILHSLYSRVQTGGGGSAMRRQTVVLQCKVHADRRREQRDRNMC